MYPKLFLACFSKLQIPPTNYFQKVLNHMIKCSHSSDPTSNNMFWVSNRENQPNKQTTKPNATNTGNSANQPNQPITRTHSYTHLHTHACTPVHSHRPCTHSYRPSYSQPQMLLPPTLTDPLTYKLPHTHSHPLT